MKTEFRKYNPAEDFIRVRDFLVDTYASFGTSINWTLERWNYARYFVIPMIGAYAKDPVSVEDSRKAIHFWEDHISLWEDDRGEIVAVTAFEYHWLGDVFFLRRPGYEFLLDEMFADAKERLVHPEKKSLQVHIFEGDEYFQSVARMLGYQKKGEWVEHIAEFIVEDEIPEPVLPPGFIIQSMADENDLEKRRKAFGRGFNHEDPIEWPSLFAYQELQRAPDYRQNLDLVVVAPDGQFVSFCIVWWDAKNRIATLEPVGTVPDYRRQGLARAVVNEGMRRAASLGAGKILVGSDQEFYKAIGFEVKNFSCIWIKMFET